MKNNKIILATGILLAVTLLGSLVSAFGTSYIFDRPLTLYPGQTRNIYVTLQNNNDPNPITAAAQLTQETEIAKMTDDLDTFVVPYQTSVQVNLSFTSPTNAKIGDTYRAELRFIPKATSGGGMGMVFLTGANIDVLIIERPGEEAVIPEEKTSMTGVLMVIGLAIIIVAIVIVVMVRKKRKK